MPELGKSKTIIDAKADAFWKEGATKNDLLFFSIPQIEYLKGPTNPDTGQFKNNPGWSANGCKTIFGFNYLLNSVAFKVRYKLIINTLLLITFLNLLVVLFVF